MRRGDLIYETLKHEILELDLMPGSPLPELALVERLGSSRTPVREALQRLNSEGLVRQVAGRGAFVSEISVGSVIELFQMRECLEAYAARLAARSHRHGEIVHFEDRLHAARETLPEDVTSYLLMTQELDREVVTLAGNQRLAAALRDVWDQVRRVRKLARTNPERLTTSVDEHLALVRAIADGHGDRAADAAASHVAHSLDNFLASVARGAIPAIKESSDGLT